MDESIWCPRFTANTPAKSNKKCEKEQQMLVSVAARWWVCGSSLYYISLLSTFENAMIKNKNPAAYKSNYFKAYP